MNRLPIRLRLALVFAVAMAAVLVAVGVFVYLRLGASLAEQLDEHLQVRASALAATGPAEGGVLPGSDEEFAQIVGADGSVRAASAVLGTRSLLTTAELTRALTGRLEVEREVVVSGQREWARLLALPVETGGAPAVVIVGGSLEERHEALAALLAELLVAGPIALLLSSVAGYLLAGAALRPVEAMRRRADEISAETPGRRLPIPESRDELFRLGETLNAMLERLDAGLRRERRFVADASHELRTPLALLRTELELALRRPRSPQELEHALRSASEEVDRLGRLAEDLLVLASTEEGRLPLRRERLSSRELLDSVAARFAARASAADRPLEVDGQVDGELTGDRLRLEQALGNLVDNALRHGSGAVRLEFRRAGDAVELRVSDEGEGFPPGFLPHALERFSRADEARARGGAGLGLAIAAAIARAHGGEASAANRAGGGAQVTISLPTG